jgi:Fic/DOC family
MYEWFTETKLALPDLPPTGTIDMLDPESYYALAVGTPSTRHRLRDNLPGTRDFCAIARRAAPMERAADLSATAKKVVGDTDPNTVRRAAAFLLLSDSKCSFEIEGESPARARLERWGKAIGKAGSQPLSLDLLAGLQKEIIAEDSAITLGLRTAAVWVGDRDRERNPKPDFIGARHEDIESLMACLMAYDRMLTADRGFNPFVHAAGLAFGFAYVHPFEDGNGRLHRYLINHALAENKFSPKGVVLPTSAEILNNVGEYSDFLRSRSGPLLAFIEWKATEHRNVEVTNDTADLYRYPDVSDESAFLAKCVAATVEHTLPNEIAFLESYDAAIIGVTAIIDMSNNQMGLLVLQTVDNDGKIPKKRSNEYKALTDEKAQRIEAVIQDAFGLEKPDDPAPSNSM